MGILWKDSDQYPLNAAFLSRSSDVRPGLKDRYLVVNSTHDGVILKANTIIPINSGGVWKAYLFDSDIEIKTLDTGSLTFGTDYYVYLCDDGSDTGVLLISANSTAPSGYDATNSRKIGGFHYGRMRNSFTADDVTDNVVVPNSVWDLIHRPKCSPEGMVDLGIGVWCDIYLASVDEAISFTNGNGSPLSSGTAKSVYNATPLTGTEGLNGYNFIELAARSGKRLLTYNEWLRAAYGSPQGNDSDNTNAWTNTNNTARQLTGYVKNAISMLNVIDCVGNVWEWLDEFVVRWDGTTGWGWKDVMSGQGVGQLYMYTDVSLVQMIAGGHWHDGSPSGSRTASLYVFPWDVNTRIGSRFACDAL